MGAAVRPALAPRLFCSGRRLTRWDVAGRLRPTLEGLLAGRRIAGVPGPRGPTYIRFGVRERERVSRRTVYFKSSVNEGYISYGENCGRTFGQCAAILPVTVIQGVSGESHQTVREREGTSVVGLAGHSSRPGPVLSKRSDGLSDQ